MSKKVPTPTIPDKRNEKGGISAIEGAHGSDKESELRSVIRVLINKNQRLQIPIMAAKKLAKHYQSLKEEVERMKQVSYNYKTGMERAERRSAQLQQDLSRLSRTESNAQRSAGDKSLQETPKGLPFYLPSSVKQLIDGLTAKNVLLMKSFQRATESGVKVESLVEQNLMMEGQIKALKEELALRSSLLEDYEAEMSKSRPKNDSDKLARSIIEQRKECTELKTKLRNYESYVKHLRERNTAILDSIMTDLDKSNRMPTESTDGEEIGAVGQSTRKTASAPTSQTVSRNNSRHGSRRESLKSHLESELQSTGIRNDSGVSCTSSTRGSLEVAEIDLSHSEHELCQKEIKELKEIRKIMSQKLQEKESEEERMKQQWLDVEETCRQMAGELDKVRQELMKEQTKTKELEAAKEDTEAIIKLMQERVDHVNSESADSGNLKERIRELEGKVAEIPLMQQVLKNYEEDIKTYGVERNQLLAKKEQLEYEKEKLQQKVRELVAGQHQLERQRSQPTSPDPKQWRQPTQYDSPQRTPQMNRFQQDPPGRDKIQEPWQATQWTGLGKTFGQQVVADGRSRQDRFDSPPEDLIHQGQRNRQLQRRGDQDPRGFHQSDHRGADESDDDDEFMNYAERDTVKCENCGERMEKCGHENCKHD